MCTDVDRNDKSRVCVPGSVRVIGRRQIEMYSRLIHTVDHIEGRLRPGFDALDAFLTHMWAVTVTGAPKTWAMQFIEDHEDCAAPLVRRRGRHGSASTASMNTGLTLRTAHIRDGIAAVRAGATLLYDSDPDAEERETQLKARALLETLADEAAGPPAGDRRRSAIAAPGARRRRRPAAGRGPARAAGGPPGLVRAHAGRLLPRAGRGGDHPARRASPPALLDEFAPDLVVLSPGPGRPADFDCDELLTELDARGLPAFGVCLGLQAMVEHAGGELALLPEPAHGKPGTVQVRGGHGGLLAGLPGRVHRRPLPLPARESPSRSRAGSRSPR